MIARLLCRSLGHDFPPAFLTRVLLARRVGSIPTTPCRRRCGAVRID